MKVFLGNEGLLRKEEKLRVFSLAEYLYILYRDTYNTTDLYMAANAMHATQRRSLVCGTCIMWMECVSCVWYMYYVDGV